MWITQLDYEYDYSQNNGLRLGYDYIILKMLGYDYGWITIRLQLDYSWITIGLQADYRQITTKSLNCKEPNYKAS